MDVEPIFRDRIEAGKALGALVRETLTDPGPLILALPRGGVPVGFEVARALRSELDVFLVRKLGVPGQEELAFGAIASGSTEQAVASVSAHAPAAFTRMDAVRMDPSSSWTFQQSLIRLAN